MTRAQRKKVDRGKPLQVRARVNLGAAARMSHRVAATPAAVMTSLPVEVAALVVARVIAPGVKLATIFYYRVGE